MTINTAERWGSPRGVTINALEVGVITTGDWEASMHKGSV
jgi:hypothetical protein